MSLAVASPRPDAAERPRDERAVRAMLGLHLAFLALVAVTVGLPTPARGWGFLVCGVVYAVALPVVARRVGREDWRVLWAFLLPVSVLQLLPDWVLAGGVGPLRFPDIGGPRIDDVIPLAMGGLWLPPLFVALAVAGRRPVVAAVVALALFAGAELLAPTAGLWEPAGDTTRVLGVAVYVLPAEAALGWAAATAMRAVGDSAAPRRWAAALAVSTSYLGALVLGHFLIDVAGWGVAL